MKTFAASIILAFTATWWSTSAEADSGAGSKAATNTSGRKAPMLHLQTDLSSARILHLGWDTENGVRAATNLLRADTGVSLRVEVNGKSHTATELVSARQSGRGGSVTYRVNAAPGATLVWKLQPGLDELEMDYSSDGDGWTSITKAELVFAFDPKATPTTVLPQAWEADGSLRLPAIVSAPDFGQMLLTTSHRSPLKARLEGSRAHHAVDLIVELPQLRPRQTCRLTLKPLRLDRPHDLHQNELWSSTRRGWFGAFQPTARWGDPGNPFSAPPGMLANNVISDPASCSLWFYADQAFWTPNLTREISTMNLVRRTLDWWLENKTLPSGEMICYWDKTKFLDANAGPIIAAWDYAETTGDLAWLKHRIERLELIADYLAHRDVDGDGLVEAVQSGNAGTLVEPGRSCAWWDALNCGHKDAYSNALIYRAWRCLADLERKMHRGVQQQRYTDLATRLKSRYFQTFFDPKTGWLIWWKSADGETHDYASPILNGLAIEYGLVDPNTGREILRRIRRKMAEVGFKRFDLGVPPMLVPVRRADYLLPGGAGAPTREDGTDTFGYYMNGGITAGQVLHFLAAHYVAGDPTPADEILRAMLSRQVQGGFQNGAVNEYPKGIDWTTWDGKPAGYEGYLSDSFRFLQAVVLREPAARARFYRPLQPQP